ncbi:UNVERIFIED_CONTAM: hypothetical protein NCL1_07162 [Trichonephila clavipes]
MRASLSSFLLTSTSSEDSSRFNRTDKSPSKSCCGDTASNSLLTPPQNGLLFIGYCAHWRKKQLFDIWMANGSIKVKETQRRGISPQPPDAVSGGFHRLDNCLRVTAMVRNLESP